MAGTPPDWAWASTSGEKNLGGQMSTKGEYHRGQVTLATMRIYPRFLHLARLTLPCGWPMGEWRPWGWEREGERGGSPCWGGSLGGGSV